MRRHRFPHPRPAGIQLRPAASLLELPGLLPLNMLLYYRSSSSNGLLCLTYGTERLTDASIERIDVARIICTGLTNNSNRPFRGKDVIGYRCAIRLRALFRDTHRLVHHSFDLRLDLGLLLSC